MAFNILMRRSLSASVLDANLFFARDLRFIVILVSLRSFHSAFFSKAVDLAAAERAENAIAQSLVFALKGVEKLLHLLALGCLVGGAGGADNRHRVLIHELLDLLFGHVDHGSDQLDAHAGEVGNGGEATESALVKEVEHKGLHHVVEVVTEGNGGASKLFCGGVERAAAHLGAERAGIFFLSDLKNDLVDLGGDDVVGDVKLLAELFDGLEVHAALKAHVDGYGDQLEFFGIEAAQICHCAEEREGVLAGGDADGDLVALLDHVVVVNSSAGIAEDSFHVFHKGSLFLYLDFKF